MRAISHKGGLHKGDLHKGGLHKGDLHMCAVGGVWIT